MIYQLVFSLLFSIFVSLLLYRREKNKKILFTLRTLSLFFLFLFLTDFVFKIEEKRKIKPLLLVEKNFEREYQKNKDLKIFRKEKLESESDFINLLKKIREEDIFYLGYFDYERKREILNLLMKNKIRFNYFFPEYFKKEEKLGILGPRFEYPDGSFQPSCRRYPRFKYLLFGRKSIGSFIFKNNPVTREFLYLDLEKENKACEVEGVVGAFMSIRREIFNLVGGFDKSFFLFAEDIDLCLRVKEKGYKIFFAPDIRIVHFHGGSRRYLGLKSEHYLRKSIFKFFKKHNSINLFSRIILNLGFVTSTALSSAISLIHKNSK
ncbi:MAG: glycosyltransferase family 2 protein [candidate division WOR-3 bacterium]